MPYELSIAGFLVQRDERKHRIHAIAQKLLNLFDTAIIEVDLNKWEIYLDGKFVEIKIDIVSEEPRIALFDSEFNGIRLFEDDDHNFFIQKGRLLKNIEVELESPGLIFTKLIMNWANLDILLGSKSGVTKLVDLDSSIIEHIQYSYSQRTLLIRFKRTGDYQYRHVPSEIFEGFVHADSVGKYFHANIKDLYNFRKVG